MTGLLVGPDFARRYAGRIEAVASSAGTPLELIVLSDAPEARLVPEQVGRIELAYFSGDVFPKHSPAFFSATLGARELRWLHCFNAGTDHPIFRRFLDRGVTLTNSPGSNAVPIAQSAIAGLLSLARRFPRFAEAQRSRTWLETGAEPPIDLAEQTLVVLGLGGIGSEIARLGRALGLHVVGVRRSDPGPEAPIDRFATPDRLGELLPLADWLAIACPLSDETRGLLDREALARLPRGARVLNVARGEIIDEAALVDALASGRLGGAYLDVFEVEPLPEASPLWSLPNVIVTPHEASISSGSQARQAGMFLANLERHLGGIPLEHVVA